MTEVKIYVAYLDFVGFHTIICVRLGELTNIFCKITQKVTKPTEIHICQLLVATFMDLVQRA